jgi:hypothetical protein
LLPVAAEVVVEILELEIIAPPRLIGLRYFLVPVALKFLRVSSSA